MKTRIIRETNGLNEIRYFVQYRVKVNPIPEDVLLFLIFIAILPLWLGIAFFMRLEWHNFVEENSANKIIYFEDYIDAEVFRELKVKEAAEKEKELKDKLLHEKLKNKLKHKVIK